MQFFVFLFVDGIALKLWKIMEYCRIFSAIRLRSTLWSIVEHTAINLNAQVAPLSP